MKSLIAVFGLLFAMFVAPIAAHATASTVTQTVYTTSLENGHPVKVYHLAVVANSSGGAVTDVTVSKIHGFLMKAAVVPGSTNPTAAYTVALLDPDTSQDSLNSAFGTLSASAAKVFYPVGASGASPLWMSPGNYTLHITGNSVNSAQTDIWLYFVDLKGPRL